jgi:hypothetical protein
MVRKHPPHTEEAKKKIGDALRGKKKRKHIKYLG